MEKVGPTPPTPYVYGSRSTLRGTSDMLEPLRRIRVPRQANRLSTERLRELARHGADTALKQLRAEIIAIERTFPELALSAQRKAVSRTIKRAEQRGRKMS